MPDPLDDYTGSGLPWEGEHGLDTATLPTVAVRHDPATVHHFERAEMPLAHLGVTTTDGRSATVGAVLEGSATDALVVLSDGVVVAEWYRHGLAAEEPRVLMSITKSVVGMVAGILVGQGVLREDAAVTSYVPELAGSGYAGATLRHLLDMRSGVRFREDYSDPTADIRRMDAAIAGAAHSPPGLHAYLTGLRADRAHGGAFEYRSCETDVLGWVCERAASAPMPELVARLLWGPIGAAADAQFLCDRTGAAVSDGGLMACAGDVARFGEMLRTGGQVGGRSVVPLSWIAQIWSVRADSRAAFADSAAAPFLPGGWYRNQCWVMPGPHGDVLLGLGIHGQLLRVDPATRTVMVKLSSWQTAQDPRTLHDTFRACEAIAAAVSGRAGRSGPRFGPGAGRARPVAGK